MSGAGNKPVAGEAGIAGIWDYLLGTRSLSLMCERSEPGSDVLKGLQHFTS